MKAIRKHLLIVLLLLSSNLLFIDPAQANLYAFTSHTFTPCGATGPTGPSLANCISTYSSSTFEDNVSYFNVTSGIQIWTVPTSGSYTITAAGAKGGRGYQGVGGIGSSITGTFSLTQGAKLRIIVGQSGTDNASLNGGGGGGSFVQNNSDLNATGIFVIAGGGGGGGYYVYATNVNAVTSNSSQPGWNGSANSSLANPSSSGNGGSNFSNSGGGGGGFLETEGRVVTQVVVQTPAALEGAHLKMVVPVAQEPMLVDSVAAHPEIGTT